MIGFPPIYYMIEKNTQKEMLQLSFESLERFPKEERDVSTLSFTLDEDSLIDAREILEKCRTDIKGLSNSVDNAERIFELNLQLFPLTNLLKK